MTVKGKRRDGPTRRELIGNCSGMWRLEARVIRLDFEKAHFCLLFLSPPTTFYPRESSAQFSWVF